MKAALYLLILALALGLARPASAELDLASWDRLLAAAVKDGHVDYSQWRDNSEFDALVEQVGSADLGSMSREQQLVFYINAYNILAARGILDGKSPASLLGRWGYFKRDKYRIAGQDINLYDFEHDLIRPLGEARIHFAIVCASASCPVLRSEAYSPERLDDQLEEAARQFINDPNRNQFNPAKGEARLSKIFDWFTEDFEDGNRSLQQYIAGYVMDAKVAAMLREDAFRIRHLSYDWSLNGKLN